MTKQMIGPTAPGSLITYTQQRSIERILDLTTAIGELEEYAPRVQRTILNYFNEEFEYFWLYVISQY